MKKKSSPFVRAQEVDDVTRVSEAVAKVVVFALKGASSGDDDDDDDDWLNPTEVALKLRPSLCFCATTQKINASPLSDIVNRCCF